jgi:aryl-alcohol dehydrogenase-like predicted oxidoreductase
MHYRNLGRSGLKVSLAGLGCNNFGWRIDTEQSRKVVHKALDLGITLLDTADMYGNRGGSEEALGEILRSKRRDVVLATKFGMAMSDDGRKIGASRRYIMNAVEDSLRRLRTDWIDLYQVHQFDPETPIEETMRALDDLVHEGKVRYIGCSNFPAWRMAEAQEAARREGLTTFISYQDELSLLVRKNETDVMPCGAHYGMGLLPFFPLASGLLTGKYKRGQMPKGARLTEVDRFATRYVNDANLAKVEKLQELAARRGKTILDLAFSWLASRPTVASVIAGATAPEQLEQNVKALEWQIGAEDLAEVDRITR